jgi:hypothetical protein
MNASARSALFLVALLAACSSAPALADTAAIPNAAAENVPAANPFDPRDVFALPDRKFIDDRCQDARRFADAASVSTDTVMPADAVTAAKAFLACYSLESSDLNPDPDKGRYLALSAAAAFYLAGTKASGSSAQRLFDAADHIAVQLGGATPDSSISTVKVTTNSNVNAMTRYNDTPEEHAQLQANAGGSVQPGPPHTMYYTKRNALSGSSSLSFGQLVDKLRLGVAQQLANAPGSSLPMPRTQAADYPSVTAPKPASR